MCGLGDFAAEDFLKRIYSIPVSHFQMIASTFRLQMGDEQMRLPSLSRVYYFTISAIAPSQKNRNERTYHKMHFDGIDILIGNGCFEISMLVMIFDLLDLSNFLYRRNFWCIPLTARQAALAPRSRHIIGPEPR